MEREKVVITLLVVTVLSCIVIGGCGSKPVTTVTYITATPTPNEVMPTDDVMQNTEETVEPEVTTTGLAESPTPIETATITEDVAETGSVTGDLEPTPTEIVMVTEEPTPTNTTSVTNTPRPTSTPKPTATNTPRPTSTPKPTVTNTPRPTSTPKPTATNTPMAVATPTPKVESTRYDVDLGSLGPLPTPHIYIMRDAKVYACDYEQYSVVPVLMTWDPSDFKARVEKFIASDPELAGGNLDIMYSYGIGYDFVGEEVYCMRNSLYPYDVCKNNNSRVGAYKYNPESGLLLPQWSSSKISDIYWSVDYFEMLKPGAYEFYVRAFFRIQGSTKSGRDIYWNGDYLYSMGSKSQTVTIKVEDYNSTMTSKLNAEFNKISSAYDTNEERATACISWLIDTYEINNVFSYTEMGSFWDTGRFYSESEALGVYEAYIKSIGVKDYKRSEGNKYYDIWAGILYAETNRRDFTYAKAPSYIGLDNIIRRYIE